MADDVIVNDEPTVVDISQYPPMFGDTTMPFFPVFDNAPKNIENKNQSEGGRDIIQTIRTDKFFASVDLSVADDAWVSFFYDLYINEESVVFKQYSPLLHGYDTRTVRITDFRYHMEKKSEKLEAVAGVWKMSFNIEEF